MFKNLSPLSRLTLAIYRLSEISTASDFQRRSLEELKKFLPFDSGMWGTGIVQDGGLKIITLHLHDTSMDMINAYQDVKNDDLAVIELAKHKSKTIGFNAHSKFFGKEKMISFVEKFKHRNIFISCRNDHETKFTEWISLYRAENSQVCTAVEIEFFDNLAPHLMQALALNRKINLESIVEGDSKKVWGLGICDLEGFIYHSSEEFSTLFASEFSGIKNNKIPNQVILNLKHESIFRGKKIVISSRSENDLLYLKVRSIQPIDLLTEIELKIAKLIAAGLTFNEISVNLCRSIDTIRTHSKSIYKKLGINKASQLSEHITLKN